CRRRRSGRPSANERNNERLLQRKAAGRNVSAPRREPAGAPGVAASANAALGSPGGTVLVSRTDGRAFAGVVAVIGGLVRWVPSLVTLGAAGAVTRPPRRRKTRHALTPPSPPRPYPPAA